MQNLPCIIPGKSPSLLKGISNSPLDDGDESGSSQLGDSTAAPAALHISRRERLIFFLFCVGEKNKICHEKVGNPRVTLKLG